MIYLLWGEDQFSLKLEIEKIKADNLPPEAMDFNFAKIDAEQSGFNVDEVINNADAFPFLADKRVVVVRGLVNKLGRGADKAEAAAKAPPKTNARGKAAAPAAVTPRERFLAYIPKLPASTILILSEIKPAKNDVIYKAVEKNGQIREFVPPKGLALEKWTTERARFHKIKLEPRAATLLAQHLGSDLYRVDNELQKLAAYAGESQTVTAEMVEKLTAEVKDTPIFNLTNALASRDIKAALLQLGRMRQETTMNRSGFSRYVFVNICKQVYDLLRIREMAAQRRSPDEIASALGLHPFVVQKTIPLTRNFTADRLDRMYHRLSELDYADKSGRADLTSELDKLIYEICNS